MKFLMLILLLYHIRDVLAYECEVKSKGSSTVVADTKFIVQIATDPEKYVPNQIYNVTVKGKNSLIEDIIQFNGFSISVHSSSKNINGLSQDDKAAGSLEIFPFDTVAKTDEKCPNVIVHSSHLPISEVTVKWTAPSPGKGCVTFRAAVMENNIWYQNDLGLKVELCEDDNAESDDNGEECQVCTEAKYELRFEGMWTRQNHPIHFPNHALWEIRFSDVIGASHGPSYRLWKPNELPSQGLIDFLKYKNTATLESEIKSNDTRTVIKAKGLKYPGITGKTFAVFRVDKAHHLISIISFLMPSPDWFVGVSGLDLCNKTEWIADKKLDLFPYDLGLYGDLQYTSQTQETNDTITKIDHAMEYMSPFHTNNTVKLKPLAQIQLIRSRVYERICSTDVTTEQNPSASENSLNSNGPGDENIPKIVTSSRETTKEPSKESPKEPEPEKEPTKEPEGCSENDCSLCKLDTATKWSQCSIPLCDEESVRGQFTNWNDAVINSCYDKVQLEKLDKKSCRRICSPNEEADRIQRRTLANSKLCPTTDWGPFSACDKETCVRVRNRTLRNEEDKISLRCAKIIFEQSIKCDDCATKTQLKREDLSSYRKVLCNI